MKLGINSDEIFRYPCAASLAFPNGPLAAADHSVKIAVDRKSEFIFASFFSEASRNVQIGKFENCAASGQNHGSGTPSMYQGKIPFR